jgi:hypothetical protein
MRTELSLVAGFVVVLLWATAPGQGREPEKKSQNTVKIRKTDKGTVEFEVTSDRAFPVIGAFPVLHVGKVSAMMSRYPDGNTRTLIFTMSAEEFAKTADGDEIRVRYNPDSQGVWEFGKLDKKKVDK